MHMSIEADPHALHDLDRALRRVSVELEDSVFRRRVAIERARERWTDIEAMAGDDEAAHSAEDALRRDALETIAALAEIALDTSHIDFARWCA